MVTRKASSKQEKRVARRFGGRTQPNSGATTFAKGDVKIPNFLIECKTKMSLVDSVSIKREWIEKIEEEAFGCGYRNSAVCFDFGDGQDYFIINEKLFKELVDFINREE